MVRLAKDGSTKKINGYNCSIPCHIKLEDKPYFQISMTLSFCKREQWSCLWQVNALTQISKNVMGKLWNHTFKDIRSLEDIKEVQNHL
jgi:hypothetical protein